MVIKDTLVQTTINQNNFLRNREQKQELTQWKLDYLGGYAL